jgi:hypothetical protein
MPDEDRKAELLALIGLPPTYPIPSIGRVALLSQSLALSTIAMHSSANDNLVADLVLSIRIALAEFGTGLEASNRVAGV